MSEPGIFDARSSGILLHPTSLPGPHGVGDLGKEAHRFVDFLKTAGQRWWQMLPVGPPGAGNSPYDSPSSFAGSSLLVSLDELVKQGLLTKHEVTPGKALSRPGRADYVRASKYREPRLRLAFERFELQHSAKSRDELAQFRAENASWLPDYTLYSALKSASGNKCWIDWQPELRRRDRKALARAAEQLKGEVGFHEFVQFQFEKQFSALRAHCKEAGILLLGDVPMFVAYDGADVWAHPDLFHLDERGRRSVVAGVPPDAFSKTGQLWGNPLYRWNVLKRSGYRWWIERFKTTLARFDAVRLDHFIGFRRYWEVAARSKTAMKGRYVQVPGEDFFETVRQELGGLPFIAEDLGIVTPEVTALRDRFALPGMRVLQFAFSDPNGSDYLPHRYSRHSVVYSGTHDNDTTVGWFRGAAKGKGLRSERERVLEYSGGDPKQIHWDVVRLGLSSVANTALFPLQDLLGLGSAARMNTPGTCEGNWEWRVSDAELRPDIAARMAELCRLFDRLPPPDEPSPRRKRQRRPTKG